jgi:quercetin dioxygenase-like cupin family protein
MNRYHAEARISIHSLEGQLRVRLSDQVMEVSTEEVIALDYAIPHGIEAMKESAFLITISWIARKSARGSKECRKSPPRR